MKKWLFAFCLVLMIVSLAFSGEWKFKKAVVIGQPEATDDGAAAVNLLGFRSPYGVAVDPDGNIWFSSYYRGRYYTYDAAGKGTAVYTDDLPWKREGKPDTTMGTIPIYVLNTNGTIDILQFLTLPDGKIDTLKAGAGVNGTFGSRGMDTDHNGNIIAAQYDRVYQIDYKTRKVMNKMVMSANVARPAVDSSGYVFAMPLAGGTLSILDPDLFTLYNSITNITVTSRSVAVTPDAKQVFIASLGAGAYRYTSAQGVDGTYAIADTILKKVRNLTAVVNFTQWDPKGLLWLASVEEQASPFMWALDPNNNFAVVDSTSFIWYKGLSDTTHPVWPRRGYAQPQYLRAPRDAAFSPDGKTMYIADMYSFTLKAYEYVTSGNLVTFKVNMSVQEKLGKFKPGVDKVVVRGSWNGWAGTADELKLGATAGVYECNVNLADDQIGKEQEYKFVNITASGDGWENVVNRELYLQAGGQVLPVVFFDNQETAAEVKTANVTFQADMTEMLTKGWFNPSTDKMIVTGSFNGWTGTDATYALTSDLLDPTLYIYVASIKEEVGKHIDWKFKGLPEANFLDNGWEGGDNSHFDFTGNPITLDKRIPNVKPAGKALKQDVKTVFSVNIKGAKDFYNKNTFQNVKSVWVTGDWNNWGGSWAPSDTSTLIKMYDNGTHSDKVAGDLIYTAEVIFAAAISNTHFYKYSIYAAGVDTLNKGTSSMDNEAGMGANHLIVINDTNPVYTNALDIFGSQWGATRVERTPSAEMPREYVLYQNYPNPFNPTTEISYSVPEQGHVSVAVYNMMGQKIATLFNGEQNPGTYRAIWNAKDDFGRSMSSGIYFYHMEAVGFSKTMKMTLMK